MESPSSSSSSSSSSPFPFDGFASAHGARVGGSGVRREVTAFRKVSDIARYSGRADSRMKFRCGLTKEVTEPGSPMRRINDFPADGSHSSACSLDVCHLTL